MQKITVRTPSMQGDIYIGKDVLEMRLLDLTSGQKNIVLVDENVYRIHGAWLKNYFRDEEFFVLESGEKNKELTTVTTVLKELLERGLTRASRLFAVGGGVIGDMGGLIAALYMRGISYVQIPTTLLAQVDSSVGGKTAVNLGGVKNVVGAFYQPCEVLVSPRFLDSLPAREIKCGLGEIIKYAALNADIFEIIEKNTDKLDDIGFLASLTEACICHKARVVERDERENGERKSLNLGHTTGHAIELSCKLSHGESVLYGMLVETKIAMDMGVCHKEYGERLLEIISRALETQPKSVLKLSNTYKIAEKATSDKKNTDDGNINLVVARRAGAFDRISLSFYDYENYLRKFL